MSKEFLVYSTENGNINHFYIDEWQFVNRYKHDTGIKKIFPEPFGVSLVFIDDKNEGFIYNPINSTLIKIPSFPSSVSGIIWESYEAEKWIFVAYNGDNIYTYVYSKFTVEGPQSLFISSTKQPYSSMPLLLFKGVMVYLDASGKIVQLKLDSHTHDSTLEDLKQEELVEKMKKNFKLKRFEEAYVYATRITEVNELSEFAKEALYHLDIDYAIRVYRLASMPDMVFALNSIKHIEEKNLLAGHCLVFLAKYDQAQTMFLASSCPIEALNVNFIFLKTFWAM